VQAVLVDSVRWTGGKQRLTATRLHELLVTEGHRVGVTVVKDAVAEWKRRLECADAMILSLEHSATSREAASLSRSYLGRSTNAPVHYPQRSGVRRVAGASI